MESNAELKTVSLMFLFPLDVNCVVLMSKVVAKVYAPDDSGIFCMYDFKHNFISAS